MSVLNSHLAAGGSLVLTDHGVMTREFWQIAEASEITSLYGVPSTYAMLRRVEFQNRGLRRLRTLCQAGGRLPDEEKRHFLALARDNGWSFFVMYGQTEASPRISYVRRSTSRTRSAASACRYRADRWRWIGRPGNSFTTDPTL